MLVQTVRLLDGLLIGELKQPKLSRRLIVICHGYQDSSANPTIVAVSKRLNEKGYTTFTFNYSPSRGGTGVEQQVGDLAAITKHFSSFEEIIIIGGSFGALSSSIAAILNPQINGLVTISGFFGRRHLGRDHRRAYILFKTLGVAHPRYRRTLRYIKREFRPERIKIPVLVIHSEVDKVVSIAQSRWFYSKLRAPKKFLTLEDAKHGIPTDKDRRTVVNTIDVWITATFQKL